MTDQNSITDKLMQVRMRFLAKSPAKLRALQRRLEDRNTKDLSPTDALVDELASYAHELVGVAPMLGLSSMGEIAREMEDVVRNIQKTNATSGEQFEQVISGLIARLEADIAVAERH